MEAQVAEIEERWQFAAGSRASFRSVGRSAPRERLAQLDRLLRSEAVPPAPVVDDEQPDGLLWLRIPR